MARHKLSVPLDATQVEDFQADRPVKVVVENKKGQTWSQKVELDARGKGSAEFDFPEAPGDLRVVVGPADGSDEEILGLQTVTANASARQWQRNKLKLRPLVITTHFWRWWRRWCRTFTVRGRVVCPDGSPVPAAEVCAYDIDFWWWWRSRQKVGSATTDADGTFEIKFRWCCGFWPWWWWRLRTWHLDPVLADNILPSLSERFRDLPKPTARPDLKLFSKLLEASGSDRPRVLDVSRDLDISRGLDLSRHLDRRTILDPSVLDAARDRFTLGDRPDLSHLTTDHLQTRSFDPTVLDGLQQRLTQRLPRLAIAEKLKLWPWFPWQPWFDCSPDLVFQVDQRCGEESRVIVSESIWDTRFDVPTNLDVTLVANEDACCLVTEPDSEGECVVLANVCNVNIENIGGNIGAPAAPEGYAQPGGAGTASDRPFAEEVRISGPFGNLAAVDYYEFEYFDTIGGTWEPMPEGSIGGFSRRFWGPPLGAAPGTPSGFHGAPFPVQEISGQRVIESRQHYEASNEPGTWGPGNNRLWTPTNYFLLVRWLTKNYFDDGTYRLRLVGWDENGGNLTNRRVLPLCDTDDDNELVLTIDNRYVGVGHPTSASHPCGPGTVHICTTEPDTDIISVTIGGQDAGPCSNIDAQSGGAVVIDFLAHDPEGHLAYYTLNAHYGENLVVNLLNAPGASLTRLGGALQVGPSYSQAKSQGAVAPNWTGGTYRLTIPRVQDAFPETCCYQLDLRAYKRNIVNCNGNYVYRNYSEYSFMVVV